MRLVATLAFSMATSAAAIEVEPADTRKALARFELKSLDGKRVRNLDIEGRVAVLSFWATWCKPCTQELDALNALVGKHEGFVVLAIATDGPETRSVVRGLVRRKKWQFINAADADGSAGASLNPRGAVPFSLFVDRKGRIAYSHAGYRIGDESGYAGVIAALLAE